LVLLGIVQRIASGVGTIEVVPEKRYLLDLPESSE